MRVVSCRIQVQFHKEQSRYYRLDTDVDNVVVAKPLSILNRR